MTDKGKLEAMHTPLPWRAERKFNYWRIAAESEPDTCIAETGCWSPRYEAEMDANAEYIVLACNNYPDLVKALEEALKEITEGVEVLAREGFDAIPTKFNSAAITIHAALKSAKGGGNE